VIEGQPQRVGDAAQARAILAADERWIEAFNRADVDALVALYAPDVVVMPPDRPDLHGRAAVADWLREFFAEQRATQTLVNDEVVVAGDWAFLRGHFELTIAAREGGRPARVRGKHLVVWRRDSGGAWLAARDLWNLGP